jgi:uncharacterized protein (TIGR02117 family)
LCCAIIATGTLYFVSALLLGLVPSRTEIIASAGDYTFHACDNGVHVDLVLPVVGGGRDWFDYFPARDFAGDVTAASHVVLGWGARGFFATTPEWRDIRPMPVLRALFWLDDSVLHVGYAGDPMGRANCRALTADAAGVARLFRFIDQSLDLTQGPPRQALAGYGLADAFYVATGRYSLFRTCNVWSAEALQESGQPMAIWSPFSFQIMRRLDSR